MLALTVLQPWASWIASGEKKVENRGWRLPRSAAGLAGERALGAQVAVHAGLTFDRWWSSRIRAPFSQFGDPDELVRGAVVAVVVFTHDCRGCADPWCEAGKPNAGYSVVGWHIDPLRTFRLDKPVPCRGRQRLWRLPPDIECAVRAQMSPGQGDWRDVDAYPFRDLDE